MSERHIETEVVTTPEKVAETVSRLHLIGGEVTRAKYPEYLPVWERTTYPDWKEVPYVDPGSRGTPDKRFLFLEGSSHREITPALGEEISGVQLSQLSNKGLDDLALLAAERGVLVFRDQDFKDIGPERQLDTVRHFGRLHIHPTMGHPKGYHEMHVVYRDPLDNTNARFSKPNEVAKISNVLWHADHAAEIQPPAVTFFFALETPESGGDTLFVSLTEAYKRLSKEYRERLEGLQVLFDNTDYIEHSRNQGGPARFSPSVNAHPLIRTHPVTGEKILHIQDGDHCKRIIGFKQEESDNLFRFLNDVLIKGGDFQLRAKWEPGTVVVWDNRVVNHSASNDLKGDARRHVVRIAAMGERPI